MADFFDAHPEVYDAYMDKINPESFDDQMVKAEYCQPDDGCICV